MPKFLRSDCNLIPLFSNDQPSPLPSYSFSPKKQGPKLAAYIAITEVILGVICRRLRDRALQNGRSCASLFGAPTTPG